MVVSSAVRCFGKGLQSVEVVAIDSAISLKERKRLRDGDLETNLTMETDASASTIEVSLYDPKTVHFSDPLVTDSWEVPRTERAMKKLLFYTPREIARFRREHRLKYGEDDKYDRVYCEQIVENLDEEGARSFEKGDYAGALEAFNHALRVRTLTNVDFTARATSRNIHCIADIYSRQKNWPRALGAYLAAMYAIKGCPERDDAVLDVIKCLKRKVALVENQMEKSCLA